MLERGVPSEPTLCRVEQSIDENGLAQRMSECMQKFYCELTHNNAYADIICVGGKVMRGTLQKNGRNPDIVTAYSASQGITLATEACEEKSNEIAAVSALLDKMDIEGKSSRQTQPSLLSATAVPTGQSLSATRMENPTVIFHLQKQRK